MAIVSGVGYLIVNDLMSDMSYALIDNPVSTTVPGGGIAAGSQTVLVFDKGMYVGAQIIVGVIGGDAEIVTITAVVPQTSFTATFANNHAAGEPVIGATFPNRQPYDPFFLQSEIIGYISQSMNDFLTDCPLAVNVATVTVAPSAALTALPGDSMQPVRVGFNKYPLRETSQSTLDAMNYRWNVEAASKPKYYFRDKTGLQNVGITPRSNATTPLEVVYNQRSAETLGMADGFIIPDPFLLYVKYRALSMALSKDGEARSPSLSKYYDQRYSFGIKVCRNLLEVISDSNFGG